MKRIITIQDISCVGRCSLTVALPIISAAGIETAVLPTAVLSTHTAFPKYTFKDLTDQITPVSDVFEELDIGFDAVYTGYLGSFEQLKLVGDFFEKFRGPDTVFFVDPVMADNGMLYPGFTPEFADKMAKLCASADLILPNITEASLILHIPYTENYDEEYIRKVLVGLTDSGPKMAAITGVSFNDGLIGVYFYDSEAKEFFSYFHSKIPASFHGTGDVFSSCVVGAYMRGLDIKQALALAVDFTSECIERTLRDPNKRFYGVNFEEALPLLIERLSNV